jgi:hypothetical protein
MAETREFAQVPDDHHPRGTLAELAAAGVGGAKLRHTPSCSEPTATSMGCRFIDDCPLIGIKAVSGPLNMAVRRVNDDDQAGETLKTCYGYMQTDHQMAMGGAPIVIAAIEEGHDSPLNDQGHTYIALGTRKVHETKDPDCPGCKRGDCALYENMAEETEIPRFKRPATMMSGILANQKMRDRIKRDVGLKAQAKRMGVNGDGEVASGTGPAGRVGPRPRKGLAADRTAPEGTGSAA